ncbi:MAG: beta-N-acetylhexosaminidase [Ruminococcaceae bacterium]|nr:beta-N-acetylhexosaminidase [Oscillospiraceae bacterium]
MANFKFKTLGVMIDMSRNSVMSVEGLKRYLPLLKKMGYNCVMLYTEDTYEVDGEPYFGYMRGRYTKDEMKELDAFAASLGITVIPCMQTLAHVNATIRWGKFPVDCADIMLVDDERTYELIDHMFATLSECFKSRKIHIGMDEAHMLGRGKHLDIHGYETVDVIMKRHLARVCEIAEKYGYEPMIWSDMFFRPWNNGAYRLGKAKIPQEYIDALPKSVIPVYWDYYQATEQGYSDMMENHAQLSKKTWFAGGSWSWEGFAPFNKFTLTSMIPAIDACKKNNMRNMFMTMWGDNGGECSHFAQLPSLFYIAQYSKGITDEAVIKEKFKRLTGVAYDDFMKLDLPNEITGNEQTGHPKNPAKYMLFSDCFNGFLDYTVAEGGAEKYADYAKQLHEVARKSRKYGYLFDTQAKLCDALAVKYELGVKTRKAYNAGDKDELRRLANEDYSAAIKLVDAFAKAFEKQWFYENKTSGFDVQDIRLGGLLRRLGACKRRLLEYADGKIDRIEELEGDVLPFGNEKMSITFNDYAKNATGNIL